MKYTILLASAACVSLLQATAQQQQPINAYAITAATKGSYIWTEVKQIDLASGEVTQSVFDNKQSQYKVFEARTGKAIAIKNPQGAVADQAQLPFPTYAAACAFDQRHNRLYYAGLFQYNELRYIDLGEKTTTFKYFTGEPLLPKTVNLTDESANITRMVIAADGHGYALTNDGNNLIRFTTGRKPVITNLGAIQDDPANGEISFHLKNTSWGGDMVADADNNLYVISARGNVFKINIDDRKATFIQKITGLPENYTTNGAAVVEDDKLIVSSANSVEGYYLVDMNNWSATKVPSKSGSVFNASDLANGNLAFAKKKPAVDLFTRQIVRNEKIGVYPNPVINRMVKVSFNTPDLGRYDIQLVDLNGRAVAQKAVSVGNTGQVVDLPVSAKLAKGMYLVKVLNAAKKTVYADQLLIAE